MFDVQNQTQNQLFMNYLIWGRIGRWLYHCRAI